MKWHTRLGRLLIIALFLIEIPRYQSTLPDDNPIVSLGMGILLAGSAYYIVESWGMLKRRPGSPPRGTGRLLVMAYGLVVTVPVIMAPAMVAHAREIETIDVLKHLLDHAVEIAWMTVVTFIPVASGMFVAYAQALQYSRAELAQPKSSAAEPRSKVAQQTLSQGSDRSANAEQNLSENERRSSLAEPGSNGRSAIAEPDPSPAEHICPGCERPFSSVQALSGHKRACKDWKELQAQEQEIPELD